MYRRQNQSGEELEIRIYFPESNPWKYNIPTVLFPASHTAFPQHQEIHSAYLRKTPPPQKPTHLHKISI